MTAANDNGRREFVYFIASPEQDAVKIGYSSGVDRLAALRTGNPSPLIELARIPAGRAVERALHDALARYRIRGEWFRDDSLFGIYMYEEIVWAAIGAESEERQVTADEAITFADLAAREYDDWVARGRLDAKADMEAAA